MRSVVQVMLGQAKGAGAKEVAKDAVAATGDAAATAAVTVADGGTAVVDYGFWSSVLHAGAVEQAIMVALLGFSVISWAIIVFKARGLRRAARSSGQFLEAFWASKRLDLIYQQAESYVHSPVSQVFRAGYVELAKLKRQDKGREAAGAADASAGGEQAPTMAASAVVERLGGDLESVGRSMRRAAAVELTQMERMVSFLATTSSTAPFIGLLGTVVGIMNSFNHIGQVGDASLATVAPGVGGALVATAFGLFAAIPAAISYNFFTAKIRVLDTEMQNFAADFLNITKRHFF